MDDVVVFLMREYGWELEYTTNLVRTLSVKKLNALIDETQHQRAIDDYRQAANSALIVACLVSDRHHRKGVKDIIGRPPERKVRTRSKLSQIAKKQGITIPKEEV